MQRLRFLWRFASPSRGSLAAGFLLLTWVSGTSLLYPWLLKLMVDRFTGGDASGPDIPALSALLPGMFALSVMVMAKELEGSVKELRRGG
ncbi:MAG: hypothetical protein WB626_11725 [Bacteroidota bacterium]